MNICVDFDGTCVSHDFPEIGKDIGAVPVLKELVAAGHNLILYTMRSDKIETDASDSEKEIHPHSGLYLTEAIKWFKDNDLPLYGINTNPTQHKWTSSPKAYGHIYIDDAALGCPLIHDPEISKKPFVNWNTIRAMLEMREVL